MHSFETSHQLWRIVAGGLTDQGVLYQVATEGVTSTSSKQGWIACKNVEPALGPDPRIRGTTR